MFCVVGILFIGSNFVRVVSFFNYVGVLYMLLKIYYKIQRVYFVFVVNRCWENEQLFFLIFFQGKVIDFGGDVRCDFLGYLVKYGIYYLVELNFNKVLVIEFY